MQLAESPDVATAGAGTAHGIAVKCDSLRAPRRQDDNRERKARELHPSKAPWQLAQPSVGFCIAACLSFDQHRSAAVARTPGPLSTIEVSIMKSLIRSALLAVGLVALSLSAHAAGLTAVTDTPLFKLTTTTKSLLMAQRNENPGGAGFRNENPGGAGVKKKGKKKKK
jgi:hypothetical protein